MKAEPNLSEFGKHVRKIRRTQQGELLLELEGKASEVIPNFKNELEATLKEIALTAAYGAASMGIRQRATQAHQYA